MPSDSCLPRGLTSMSKRRTRSSSTLSWNASTARSWAASTASDARLAQLGQLGPEGADPVGTLLRGRERLREGVVAGERRGDLPRRSGARAGSVSRQARSPARWPGRRRARVPTGGGGAFPRRRATVRAVSTSAVRPAAGEELVEHEPERVDVAPDRGALARELLGRHVGGRARDLALDHLARARPRGRSP